MTQPTYGRHDAKPGDRCSNSPGVTIFTTPCCYSDQKHGDRTCSECGAPIACEYEDEPIAVCTIRDLDEEDEQ